MQKNNYFFWGITALIVIPAIPGITIDSNEAVEINPVINKQKEIALTSTTSKHKAFLDTIAYAEGTYGKGDNGYNIKFGGSTFSDYSKHPDDCVTFKLPGLGRRCSTAAGRYQIMNFNATKMPDFSPKSQDLWTLNKLKQINALKQIDSGNISKAIALSCSTWASFPCYNGDKKGRYNQPVKPLPDLISFYNKRLKTYR